MRALLEIGLTNAALATLLAAAVLVVGILVRRRPALLHALWLIVLVKLITPPLFSLPVLKLPPSAEVVGALNPAGETLVKLDDSLEEILLPPIDLTVQEPDAAGLPTLAELAIIGAAGGLEEALVLTPPPPVAAPMFIDPIDLTRRVGEMAAGYGLQTVFGLWIMGAVAWFVVAGARVLRFQRLLRHAEPAPPELQDRVAYHSQRLGIARIPTVWLVPGVVSPMLWAIGLGPRLILPAGLVQCMRWSHLDTLLLHELAHVRRRDHWVRWVELLVTGLYWWNPVVWWARRELRRAEEQCCDAWVVWALPQAARSYALALVETVDFLSAARPVLPVAASGLGQVDDLKRRVTMIMRGRTPRALTWAGCLTVVGVGAALLAVRPTFADDDKKPDRGEGRERRDAEKRPDRPAARDGERGGADLEKARAELREMAEQMNRLQEQMKATEERFRQARERMEQMERGTERGRVAPNAPAGAGGRAGPGGAGGGAGIGGGAGGAGGGPAGRGAEGGRGGGGPSGPAGLPPGGPGAGPRGPGAGAPGGFGGGGAFPGGGGGFGGGMAGFGGGADVTRRLEALEKKIDRLMEEFERMRGGRDTPPTPPARRGDRGGPDGPGVREGRRDPAPVPPPVVPPTPAAPRRDGELPRPPRPPGREGAKDLAR